MSGLFRQSLDGKPRSLASRGFWSSRLVSPAQSSETAPLHKTHACLHSVRFLLRAVWAAWMTLVLTGVLVFRTVYREWEDWDLVADVAEIASWTGIGILSFTGVAQWLQILFTYD